MPSSGRLSDRRCRGQEPLGRARCLRDCEAEPFLDADLFLGRRVLRPGQPEPHPRKVRLCKPCVESACSRSVRCASRPGRLERDCMSVSTRLENWRDCCAACKTRAKVLGSRASQVRRRHRPDPDRDGLVRRNIARAFATFSTWTRYTLFVRAPPHSAALLAFERASAVARARRSHVRWDRFQQCGWRICARDPRMSAAVVASAWVVCAQHAARPGK